MNWRQVGLSAVWLGAGAAVAVAGFLLLRLFDDSDSSATSASTNSSRGAADSVAGATSNVDDHPINAPAPPTVTRPPLGDTPDPGPAPDNHGFSDEELAEAVASSVRVSGAACRGVVREASGFAVADGDLVVSIAHLMTGMSEPTVELADGRVLPAQLVAVDLVNDLSVLRVPDAQLKPLPLSEAVPDGTVGAVLAWEGESEPDPTPFRIDRPVTVLTDPVGGGDRIRRPSWLLAADTELGDSGAALAVDAQTLSAQTVAAERHDKLDKLDTKLDNKQIVVVGVAWGASRRGSGGVAYATRSGAVQELLDSSDLDEPVAPPACN